MSYESDSETKQSQDSEAAVATAQANIPTQTAVKDSATQWQDLSLVSKVPAVPEIKRNTPVSSRWDSRTTPSKESKERSSTDEQERSRTLAAEDQAEIVTPISVGDHGHFGPALPPGT